MPTGRGGSIFSSGVWFHASDYCLVPLALVDIDARVVLLGVPSVCAADVALQRDEVLAHLGLGRVAQRAHGLRGGVSGELRNVLGLTGGLLL